MSLSEEWYVAINEATGVYTTRRESDRVADALEPLLRKAIADEILTIALYYPLDSDLNEGFVKGLESAALIVKKEFNE